MEFYRELAAMLPLHIVIPVALVIMGLVIGVGVLRGGRRPVGGELDVQRDRSTRWATKRDLADLLSDAPAADPRKLVLGGFANRWVMNVGQHRSVAVVAPSGMGKTPRVVVPAVLRHRGPVVCTSVKSDVLALTRQYRRKLGPVWVVDPGQESGIPDLARWSPLLLVGDYATAVDVAARLTDSSSRASGPRSANDEFWQSMARMLIAPLLVAAALTKRSMSDVADWVITHDELTPEALLADLKIPAAERAWAGFRRYDPRSKANMIGAAVSIMETWAHPLVADLVDVHRETGGPVLDISDFITEARGTIYLVGSRERQQIMSPIFEMLTSSIVAEISARYQRTALPMSPPLLMMLDEAANICRVRNLDGWASSMQGQGMVLVTVWQDEAQLRDAYGPDRADAILANHTSTIYLAGITHSGTLATITQRIGTASFTTTSTSRTSDRGPGSVSSSTSTGEYDVAPTAWLQDHLRPGQALVFAGDRKPARLTAPGWWELPELRREVPESVASAFDALYTDPGSKKTVKLR